MSRPQALAVSLLLALAAASGAWAVGSTSALRGRATKPEVASAHALAKRARQLDAWEASLAQALRSRPPALPAVPRYAPLALGRSSEPGGLPALVLSRPSAQAKQHRSHSRSGSVAPAGVPPAPATGDAPSAAPATAPGASSPPPAAAQPPPAPAASTPQPASIEQQCEQLKKAAEGKGEAAKRAAEQQCEQLQQAAEGQSDQRDGGHD